ncbi:MAG TPA: hypothetical protein VK886_19225 [Vicinamibacterales bacterium]|nr:hypothetical protein [Vicinamibacterales bacterium]
MSEEHLSGGSRKATPSRVTAGARPERHGTPLTGRIVSLLIGQCQGFIRLPDERDVYFHRADLGEGTAFNDLRIGDVVRFELFEDAVSGARALRVSRETRR